MTTVNRVMIVLLILFCCLSGVKASEAYVFEYSDMKLYNPRFGYSDPNAQFVWKDVYSWYGTVQAHAQDTETGSSGDFDYLAGDYGKIGKIANTSFVSSYAEYKIDDGFNISIDPRASLEAFTKSWLKIDELGAQGDGHALATFDNFFKILKIDPDIPGTTVSGTFLIDYVGNLQANADNVGYFSTALEGVLKIFSAESDFALVESDSVKEVHSGRGDLPYTTYTGTLSVNATFKFYSSYWLYAEADSEVYGSNAIPEPATFALMTAGIAIIFWRARKQS